MTDWAEWSRQAVAAMQARNEAWITRFGLARAPYRWDLVTAELLFERGDRSSRSGPLRGGNGLRGWKAPSCGPGTTMRFLPPPSGDWVSSARSGPRTIFRGSSRRNGLAVEPMDWRCWPSPDGFRMRAEAFVDREGALLLFFTLHQFRVRPRPETASGAATQHQAPRR